jgi:aminobenzoyl-glutamate transport protein
MVASTFLIAIIGTWVNKVWIEPKLGIYKGDVAKEDISQLSIKEKKGLKWAFITFLIWIGIFLAGLIPDGGFLRDNQNSILHSPCLKDSLLYCFLLL